MPARSLDRSQSFLSVEREEERATSPQARSRRQTREMKGREQGGSADRFVVSSPHLYDQTVQKVHKSFDHSLSLWMNTHIARKAWSIGETDEKLREERRAPLQGPRELEPEQGQIRFHQLGQADGAKLLLNNISPKGQIVILRRRETEKVRRNSRGRGRERSDLTSRYSSLPGLGRRFQLPRVIYKIKISSISQETELLCEFSRGGGVGGHGGSWGGRKEVIQLELSFPSSSSFRCQGFEDF